MGLLIQLYGNFALLHSLLASLRNLIIYLISKALNLVQLLFVSLRFYRRVARQTLPLIFTDSRHLHLDNVHVITNVAMKQGSYPIPSLAIAAPQ